MAGLLLKKYKERFATAPVAATYRYLRQWAADSLPANPLVRPPSACAPAWAQVTGTFACTGKDGSCAGWQDVTCFLCALMH